MKKVIAIILAIVFAFALTACSNGSLPKGKASEITGMSSGGGTWSFGSGYYEYINETTIKFIRDKDGKTYYLSAGTLMYIIEETETEGEK